MRTVKQACYIVTLAAVAAVLAIAAACALSSPKPAPAISTEGKAAVYAAHAMIMADAVLTALDQSTEVKLRSVADVPTQERIKAQTRSAAMVGRELGQTGVDLAGALRAWHAIRQTAGEEGPAADRVRKLLRQAQELLPDLLRPLDDGTIRNVVVAALKAVTGFLDDVQAILPATQPAT